jgi:hypothetical protein
MNESEEIESILEMEELEAEQDELMFKELE